jgi:foldase protein PrsA
VSGVVDWARRYHGPPSMRITRRYAAALGAVCALALAVAACGSGIPGNSVADVAGNPITLRAFDHWMYVAAKGNAAQAPGAPVIVPNDPPGFANCIREARAQISSLRKTPTKTLRADCKQLFTSLSSQVMGFLITSYWYQLEANRLHIRVTTKQVQSLFATQVKAHFPASGSFEAFLKQTGQTRADILYRFKVDTILQKLVARDTKKVTPAAIRAYYYSHASQFGSQQTRDIRLVRTNSLLQAKLAKAALERGQSWCAVAKRYSLDAASRSSCGLLTGITPGEEEHALNAAVFSAPVGRLEGPVHGVFGYYVLEVTKVTPATHEPLAKAAPTIKQLLQSQYASAAQQAVDQQARKQWLSRTHCRSLYMMSDCAGYKAPKSPA